MGKHAKTKKLIEEAYEILDNENPMTVRQVYYQLVSRQVIENNRSQYQAVSNALVDARKEGIIPWKWIEDRLRQPREVQMWWDFNGYLNTVLESYRSNVWPIQHNYVECWLEKDALSGIFEDILWPYGVTLNVGRGYDGWASIYNAAQRYELHSHQDIFILYFGDFDPSGEDMVRSLGDRLEFFGCKPNIIKCALTIDDISHYNLPPDFTKPKDTRSAAFVAKNGNIAVELDALPIDVLRTRLKNEVEKYTDLEMLDKANQEDKKNIERLRMAINSMDGNYGFM